MGGSIVVGMYVEGGKSGKQGLIKEHIKETLSWLGFSRFNDYHVWHPTYLELISLLEASGFKVTRSIGRKVIIILLYILSAPRNKLKFLKNLITYKFAA
jgi:hypothetical protein